MKILILSSLSFSLVNFRGELIRQMIAEGHEVIACAPDRERAALAALSQMGARFRHTPMARAGTNPFADLRTLVGYCALLRQERPDVVVAYTQKPIIYGGMATRLVGGVRFYAIMSGLGYVFSDEARHQSRLRMLVSRLYRAGVRDADCIFVFNSDDRRLMLENGIVDTGQTLLQVPGSGVDVRHFALRPMPAGPITFLMMGRLMRDKGVGDFVDAARIVRARWPAARFLLLGRPETENPTGYGTAEIDAWREEGVVEFLPETRDVRPYLEQASVFVLPSYYREGLPRTILEALATGRPVVTTDLPGCREPIRDGINGFLIPPRDPEALAATLARFCRDEALLARMGAAARATAVDDYDVDGVNRILLDAMALSRSRPMPAAIPEEAAA